VNLSTKVRKRAEYDEWVENDMTKKWRMKDQLNEIKYYNQHWLVRRQRIGVAAIMFKGL